MRGPAHSFLMQFAERQAVVGGWQPLLSGQHVGAATFALSAKCAGFGFSFISLVHPLFSRFSTLPPRIPIPQISLLNFITPSLFNTFRLHSMEHSDPVGNDCQIIT